jgi:hypothetical protein
MYFEFKSKNRPMPMAALRAASPLSPPTRTQKLAETTAETMIVSSPLFFAHPACSHCHHHHQSLIIIDHR